MGSPHRYRRAPTTAFDIIDSYLDSLTNELGSGVPAVANQPQQQESTSDECSRSSSIYSTDTLKGDTATLRLEELPRADHSDTSIREVFRNLCQVSLHIANLRHARDEAHKELEEADNRVDDAAYELVRKRLGRTDQIDSSNLAISQVIDILTEGDGKNQSNGKRDVHDNGTAIDRLQKLVCHAKQLKGAFYARRKRLETGQRVLLWPTLEQWRVAVDDFRKAGQHRGPEARVEQAASSLSQPALRKDSHHTTGAPPSILAVSSLDDLDRVAREIEILLPHLGRLRLEHLLGYITAALQQRGPEDVGNYVPNFI